MKPRASGHSGLGKRTAGRGALTVPTHSLMLLSDSGKADWGTVGQMIHSPGKTRRRTTAYREREREPSVG